MLSLQTYTLKPSTLYHMVLSTVKQHEKEASCSFVKGFPPEQAALALEIT